MYHPCTLFHHHGHSFNHLQRDCWQEEFEGEEGQCTNRLQTKAEKEEEQRRQNTEPHL